MKPKPLQKLFILGQLKEHGYITRNQCLRNYISRLGAIICSIPLTFDAGYMNNATGKDYIYVLKNGQKKMLDNVIRDIKHNL